MKKTAIAGMFSLAAAASSLAQGTVIFENSASVGNVYDLGASNPFHYAVAGTYTLALLWAPGTSVVPQAQLTQIALYGLATGGPTSTGFFTDSATITTGAATVGGTAAIFEVLGWTGNYTSYAAAIVAGARVGATAEFVNGTGNPNPPATPPVQTTGWDGNIILGSFDPEPSTIAIAGAGAGLVWYARRRKAARKI